MHQDGYWYWLSTLKCLSYKKIEKLLQIYGTPMRIYHEREENLVSYFLKEDHFNVFRLSKNEGRITSELHMLEEKGISFLHPDSILYPESFRCMDVPPYGLYLKGKMPPRHQKTMAIIGARNCTRYGSEMARYFGRELAKRGLNIISGLARGIDGMAHVGAIEAGGYTMGVLGCGIDVVYPEENYKLFMSMEKEGGILSESGLGIKPSPWQFPHRNRLIAGLADGILVVEATEKSGTFITVDHALAQGKDVFAIPGRVMDEKSVGCNNLIKLGAHVVTEVNDILDYFQMTIKDTLHSSIDAGKEELVKKMSLAPLEKMLYSVLEIEPKYIDDIIREVRLAPQEVSMALNRLVVEGVIAEPIRNYYAIRL